MHFTWRLHNEFSGLDIYSYYFLLLYLFYLFFFELFCIFLHQENWMCILSISVVHQLYIKYFKLNISLQYADFGCNLISFDMWVLPFLISNIQKVSTVALILYLMCYKISQYVGILTQFLASLYLKGAVIGDQSHFHTNTVKLVRLWGWRHELEHIKSSVYKALL